MASSNCYSSLYPFPIDLNEDDQQHKHPLLSFKTQPPPPPPPSSSLTCPSFFNQTVIQEPAEYYQKESQQFPEQEDLVKKYVPQDGPLESDTGLKLSVWKTEERFGSPQNHDSGSSTLMSSKMRKMTSSDHGDLSNSSRPKFEDQKLQPSPSADNSIDSSYNSNNNNTTIRVCADCNTTKTPLWRSGPRGPKSLCNACGIRQRKARRAMAAAAAAAANGSVAAETTPSKKSKVEHKGKRLQTNKKCKLSSQPQGRKKLCFEDLRMILSKNSAFHGVFPQDEKEAAVLLMALSYGLVHG